MKNSRNLEPIKFEDIRNYQFAVELSMDQNNEDKIKFLNDPYQYIDMKLTICKAADDKCKINFLPMIYQEKQQTLSNVIMVFDITKNKIVERLSIAPSPENED